MDREETMNKLKMLALTTLAAASIGTGAFAAAPSASAATDTPCRSIAAQVRNSLTVAGIRVGQGEWDSATKWFKRASDYARLYADNC